MALSPDDLRDLQEARRLLENPGLSARIIDLIGTPIETGLRNLPASWRATVDDATQAALGKALDLAIWTLGERVARKRPANALHKAAVTFSGGLGGAFGLAGLSVELPASTAIILRSIADIARSEGEDLAQVEARLQCLHVLAFGGRSESDDGTDTGYFAVRAAMAHAVSDAAAHLARKGLSQSGAPLVVRLIAQISSRFSIVVSQKAAAQAIPAIGAAGGALVNVAFIDHFQGMARGHFIIRRLERAYGAEAIERLYGAST